MTNLEKTPVHAPENTEPEDMEICGRSPRISVIDSVKNAGFTRLSIATQEQNKN